jgi:3-deoxy-D-manno-octulosonic-acid transferase
VLLYRVLSTAAAILYAPYALLRSATGRRRMGSLRGRLARGPLPDLAGGIWIHAVSVGEVGVARSLLAVLAERAPSIPRGLSVTTAAGYEVAQRAASERLSVFWFPLDLEGPVERTLAAVRPGLVLLTETEIWPLFLDRASRRGIPVALVNGRISERSFARYRRLGGWLVRTLDHIQAFAMQSEADAERIRRLGADPARVRVTGNVKFDLPVAPPFADAVRLRAAAAGRPVLVAASTAEGEEAAALDAWSPLSGRALLAIAPRRPERFEAVADLVRSRGFDLIRRSRGDSASPRTSPIAHRTFPVYLLDTMGELASLYREASLAFVGGSLAPVGGHNPIEAWAQGVCVVTGPHTGNFRDVVREGMTRGLLETAADASELAEAFGRAVDEPEANARRGAEAARAVAENRGAAAATAALVLPLTGGKERRAAAP